MTIAKYSALLEPTVNILQTKAIVMIAVGEHIEKIIEVIENDRSNAEQVTNELLAQARRVATVLDIELSLLRLAVKQKHRSNPPSNNEDEYWRRCIVIPYLDSLTASFICSKVQLKPFLKTRNNSKSITI
ncbi:uncharacterized protein LOC120782090 [Bactrocera tryoni]|uniref:uncharacterized protein LOC120782090 n=1 Tax=Bactrocera tryoni TaxID=59916 RepID=UPI001A95A4FF|nr:uncharacterized protein LOC120782090 [Bactrocera tryoni]